MSVLERVGERTQRFFEYAGGLAQLGGSAATFIAKFRISLAQTISQAYLLGYQSFIIVALTSFCTGAVISLESAMQAVQYGFASFVGTAVAYGSGRELGPLLTGIVVAGRAGSAITAEIGSMVVTEQIEALRSMGIEPARYLVVPRLLALTFMLPMLTVFADVISLIGGMWFARAYAHIGFGDFINSARAGISFDDFLKGLFKSLVFGIIIALVGAFQGLRTRGGAAGVGKATTGAVVIAMILIFIANFALSFLLYGSNG